MKRRIVFRIAAVIAAVAMVMAYGVTAVANGDKNAPKLTRLDKPADYTAAERVIPMDYDPHDTAKLRAFFEQAGASNIKNGDILFENYNADDPSTWVNDETISLRWNSDGQLWHFGTYITGDGNPLTSNLLYGILDLSGCQGLEALHCGFHTLTEVNVADCPTLLDIWVPGNQIHSVNVQNCVSLVDYVVQHNLITEINADGLAAMEELICDDNPITSISLDECRSLKVIQCRDVVLGTIDLTDCVAMESLRLPACGLDEVLISEMPNVKYIALGENNLTHFDLSTMPLVETVGLSYNKLETLTVGAHNEEFVPFNLNLAGNKLTQLDLTESLYLILIDVRDNNMTSFDFSGNPILTELYCDNNNLTTLDLTSCPYFCQLSCEGNPLTSISMNTVMNGFMGPIGNHACAPQSVAARGNGTVTISSRITNMDNGEYAATGIAHPHDGERFVGWYSGGELYSTELAVDMPQGTELHLTAVFSGSSQAVPGDANGDGVCSIEDAMMVMRHALELMTLPDECLQNCDVNGDSVVNETDALLIMRAAMGLLAL